MSLATPARRLLLTTATACAMLAALLGGTPEPSAEAASAPYCGKTLTKTTGGTWQCTFSDHFNGTVLDNTRWTPLLTSRSGVVTPDCRINNSQTIQVSSGSLKLRTYRTATPMTCTTPTGSYTTSWAGGAVATRSKFFQTYGRFEARVKFPNSRVAGLHSAFWMWPEKQVYGSLSGEIDIAEWRSAQPGRVVPTVHYDDEGKDPAKTNYGCYISTPASYHTYALEWTPSQMRFLYDGKVCLVNKWVSASGLTRPAPFDEAFFMILNQAVGTGGNAPTSQTLSPAAMTVDYVRAWR